jgi:hypothetical protein
MKVYFPPGNVALLAHTKNVALIEQRGSRKVVNMRPSSLALILLSSLSCYPHERGDAPGVALAADVSRSSQRYLNLWSTKSGESLESSPLNLDQQR